MSHWDDDNTADEDDGSWDDWDDEQPAEPAPEDEQHSETEVVEEQPTTSAPAPEDVPIELDPEDPDAVPEQFYTVQYGYEKGDTTVEPGTQIEVKCADCALWEAELSAFGGKPLCAPGVRTTVQIKDQEFNWRMHEGRYSCQSRFVPMELDGLLEYVTADAHDTKILLMAIATAKRVVQLQDRVRKYCARNGLENREQQMLRNMLDVLVMFDSLEQIKYVEPFLSHAYKLLKAKEQQRKAPTQAKKQIFRGGDQVSWLSRQGGPRVSGMIRVVKNGQKTIVVTASGKNAQTLQPTAADAWQEQNPDAHISTFRIEVEYDKVLWKKLDPQQKASTPLFRVAADEQD